MSVLRAFNSVERFLLRHRVAALVTEWRQSGKRVVIYGAGFHTKKLLEITNLPEAHIIGVSDTDANKHGQECGGRAVIPPEQIVKIRPDVILISSKDCESEIYRQLQGMTETGVELVQIYAGSAMSRLFKLQSGVLRAYEGMWSAAWGLHDRVRDAVSGPLREAELAGRQRSLAWNVAFAGSSTWRELASWLRERGVHVKEGGHTIYIPPQDALGSVMPDVVAFYPRCSGFKILKSPRRAGQPKRTDGGSGNGGGYVSDVQRQQITANYMHALGVGPRLWDVCTWRGADVEYTVSVVDNVAGAVLSEEECRAFLRTLRDVISKSHLRITMAGWEERDDFSCPRCNDNLIASDSLGAPQYVDFQHFTCTPTAWRREIVSKANGAFHFGDTWLGQRPLYQSVPGGSAVGKRNSAARWSFMAALLRRAGLDVGGRVVLDVGCNAGMMLQAALAAGAAWAIGWDRPEVVPFASDLLFSLGASRFQLIGANLHTGYALEATIPAHVKPKLEEAVVFYLSVRDHIGLLEDLKRIPWRALVYEGHQAERVEDSCLALRPLLTGATHIASSGYIDVKDGDVDARPIVLLVRK